MFASLSPFPSACYTHIPLLLPDLCFFELSFSCFSLNPFSLIPYIFTWPQILTIFPFTYFIIFFLNIYNYSHKSWYIDLYFCFYYSTILNVLVSQWAGDRKRESERDHIRTLIYLFYYITINTKFYAPCLRQFRFHFPTPLFFLNFAIFSHSFFHSISFAPLTTFNFLIPTSPHQSSPTIITTFSCKLPLSSNLFHFPIHPYPYLNFQSKSGYSDPPSLFPSLLSILC